MGIAIKVENLGKAYQLGEIGTGTISRDLERYLAKLRGKEDPFLKIGESNDRTTKGNSDIVWSLKDLNFEIAQGDAVGIIGRNGAGKSTLLKILSRVTSPTTGNVKVKGRVASLLEVGTGFHPELTGRENIFLNGAILGMRKAEIKKHFDAIVDFAGVDRYVDTPVKRYSSGMYVRLAFAVAAHLDSEILVVDEVLAVGDAEFQKKCLGKMNDVSESEGRTVLFVSHNMGSVQKLCSKGILLKDGMLQSKDNIQNIIHLYVKGNNSASSRFVQFNSIKLKQKFSFNSVGISVVGKNANATLDVNDKIKVKINYSVFENLKGVNISLELHKEGMLLFRTWDIDNDKELFINRLVGDYETLITLPNFLTIGTYSLSIAAGHAGVGLLVKHEDCINFDIENINTDSSHTSLNRGGVIKTNLTWNTIKE